MSTVRSTPTCYLCGSAEEITRDHVPPQSFFPPPRPKDLITVPCCRRCNVEYSKDDEAFRLWVTAPPNISEAGRWIQQHRVFESSFKRSPKLVENVRKAVRQADIRGQKVDLLDIPKERADRFLIRLTKGLLTHFYPTFPRDSQVYTPTHLTLFQTGWEQFARLRDAATYDSRGNGVFQFRHRVSLDRTQGYWLYVFYEAAFFIVWHESPPPTQHQPGEPTPAHDEGTAAH